MTTRPAVKGRGLTRRLRTSDTPPPPDGARGPDAVDRAAGRDEVDRAVEGVGQVDPAADGETTTGAADGDLADDGDERGPLRRCIVTRVRDERARMIRFVVGPGDVIVPDLAARLPGRGIWLSARGDVLESARRKGAFARAARGQVTVPPDLAAIVETGLARRAAELIGFARRAGQAVAGFSKARDWLEQGRCGLLVQACDGSSEECRRLRSGFAVVGEEKARDDEIMPHAEAATAGRAGRTVKVAAPLDAATLGAVFGRDHIVHVAIAPGRLAGSIATEAGRLSGFRQVALAPGLGSSDRQVHER